MHHHSCCAPTPCGGAASWQPCPTPMVYYCYVPWCFTCGQPSSCCRCCHEERILHVPRELTVDGGDAAATAEAVVGGVEDVEPVLETLPATGAANPEVTLEKVDSGTTTLYHALPVAAGYAVKDDLADVSPGAKLRLTANGCFARLRWCERMEY